MTHDFWFWAFLLVLALLIIHMLLFTLTVNLAKTAMDGWERSIGAAKEMAETEKLARAINEWNRP